MVLVAFSHLAPSLLNYLFFNCLPFLSEAVGCLRELFFGQKQKRKQNNNKTRQFKKRLVERERICILQTCCPDVYKCLWLLSNIIDLDLC